ncbi:MAG: FAD binding domain-containing protein [Treponema sp.]|jgi:CO/xanthine dehydrogenase FAD-binding subunit|nr:FAD binding domain-containing protein [Treponema sp.]
MDDPLSQVFFPTSLHELFSTWSRFPGAVPYAGGTDIVRKQGETILELPHIILSLNKLDELHRITRTEHYLEIGSMVKLNQIISMGKIVPESLCVCLENIAGIQLRNIATIGGNICCPSRFLDTSAVFTALEAQFELRGTRASRWISASRFFTASGRTALENQELLTRIRLPMDQWDYSIYKKFYSENVYNSEVMVFLAKTQKNILTDIRVICKTDIILRNKTGEGILSGERLPLTRKAAGDFLESWKEFFEDKNTVGEFSKNEFINCIETNIYNLSE